MNDDLNKIMKWKSITSNRIEMLIRLYDKYICGEESEIYKRCKCESSLRIMLIDLKKYCSENNI